MDLSGFICDLGTQNIAYAENEILAYYTSFKIGGKCKLIIEPKSSGEISFCIKKLLSLNMKYCIVGNGSNILFSDDGFDGVIIRLGEKFSGISADENGLLKCQAGVPLSKICKFALQNSLSGLEFAWGIPGTVGGAVFMNAGAYGGEISDVVSKCEHLDENGNEGAFDRESLDFSYRHSIYDNKSYCITDVYLKLFRANQEEIKRKMDDYLNRRKSKQPLDFPSAGSTFKRPAGNYASALIEKCGLKGLQIGDAQVSEKHSGFIINKGKASCMDVLELIDEIKRVVYEKTGYRLECELKIM